MRVIAGTARGRAIQRPREAPVRPTSDVVKGAIFSMLEAEAYKRGLEADDDGLAAAHCWPTVLDLYAGTGALGIEALSRGALAATFVEHNPLVLRAIGVNLEKLGLMQRATLRQEPVGTALLRLRGPFDLVLADPPYAEGAAVAEMLASLEERRLLASGGVVVIEQAATSAPVQPPESLEVLRVRRHGGSRVTILVDATPSACGHRAGDLTGARRES